MYKYKSGLPAEFWHTCSAQLLVSRFFMNFKIPKKPTCTIVQGILAMIFIFSLIHVAHFDQNWIFNRFIP